MEHNTFWYFTYFLQYCISFKKKYLMSKVYNHLSDYCLVQDRNVKFNIFNVTFNIFNIYMGISKKSIYKGMYLPLKFNIFIKECQTHMIIAQLNCYLYEGIKKYLYKVYCLLELHILKIVLA